MAIENEVAGAAMNAGVYQTLGTIGATLLGLLAAAFPVMKLIERWGATRADGSRASAESALYHSLKDQIEGHARLINDMQTEKLAWLQEQAALRERVRRLEETEAQNSLLKSSIAAKDAQITDLISEIVKKTTEIAELRERIHQLELRLARDEARMDARAAGTGT